ncbi:MAG: hypothetical protein IJ038_04285 [Clostridia bacterium]|nr:hypothetical protein [Clostridia bacterium]
MNNSDIKNDILALKKSADATAFACGSYAASIDTYSLFSFAADEKNVKRIYYDYRRLTSLIIKEKEMSDASNARVAALVCQADKEQNSEIVKEYYEIFERYRVWCASASSFMQSSDKEFKKDAKDLKLSALLSYAQIFLISTKNLIGFLNEKASD